MDKQVNRRTLSMVGCGKDVAMETRMGNNHVLMTGLSNKSYLILQKMMLNTDNQLTGSF